MKNINFKKFFMQSSPMPHIKQIIGLAYEACSTSDADLQ